MNNEVVLVDGQLPSTTIEKYVEINRQIQSLTEQLNQFKAAIQEAMKKEGYKSIDNEMVKVTYTPPKKVTTEKVDIDGLIEQGLYHDFVTEVESERKESWRWTWR